MTGPPVPRDDEGDQDRDRDGGVDVEAAFAEIISHWDAESPPVGRWPAVEDADETDTDGPRPDAPRPGAPRPDGPDPERPDAARPGADRPAPERPGDEKDEDDDDWGPVTSHVGGERVRQAAVNPPFEEPEEGYVPPEPPPLPRPDLITALAWVGAVGVPLFFLVCAVFWRTVPQVLILTGLVAFVAGAVTLVLRMPSSRDPDDDDGAVV